MKAYITWDHFGGAKVYFLSHIGTEHYIHYQVYCEGKTTWAQDKVDLANPNTLPPRATFDIPFVEAREFLVSLGEAVQVALANAHQFGPTNVDVLKGELKATKEHLEDMRRLVFEGLPEVDKLT